MGLSFDPAKRAWTLRHRALDFADAGAVFEGPVITFEDKRPGLWRGALDHLRLAGGKARRRDMDVARRRPPFDIA
jgi:hypothetical protein